MASWLNGHEFEQALGVGDGQGGLACCSPWGRKESDTTEWLNWLAEIRRWGSKGWKFQLCRRVSSADLMYNPGTVVNTTMPVLVTQPCPTLRDPMDCGPPGSSVHGVLPRRILAWITIPFCRQSLLHLRSSQPRNWTQVSRIAGRFFTIWVIITVYKLCTWPVLRELILNALTVDTHRVVTVG